MFAMKSGHHRLLLHPEKLAIGHGRSGPHAKQLPGQRTLAKKTSAVEYPNGGFFAGLGYDRESHAALLDVENRVRSVPLGEDCLLLRNGQKLPSVADGREEGLGVELAVLGGDLNWAHLCRL